MIPPQTRVGLPDTPSDYPIVYLLNLEDEAGRQADSAIGDMAEAAGRTITRSAPRYALNYSNGDPVAFVAVRID